MYSTSYRGFTLIELLMTVAIIALLAVIALPNFLEAQVRSKVSRTKSDMRIIAMGLESYAVDHNQYPEPGGEAPRPSTDDTQIQGPQRAWTVPLGPDPSIGWYAAGLTSPIAYVTSEPKDPFGGPLDQNDSYAQFKVTHNYWYATQARYEARGFPWQLNQGPGAPPSAKWNLQTRGPDGTWARNFPEGAGAWEVDAPYLYQYDPTNGSVSIGNVVRTNA